MEEPASVVAERIVRELTGAAVNSNQTKVQINAEGFGVWVATTAAAVMLGANVFLAALVIDHNRQISDLKDYLQVIFQHAPYLKEKADGERAKE